MTLCCSMRGLMSLLERRSVERFVNGQFNGLSKRPADDSSYAAVPENCLSCH